MEPFEDLLEQAERQAEIAHHLLTDTYLLVNDPKMFPAILERIYNALDYALTAVLRSERNLGHIPPYEDSFESRFEVFQKKVAPQYRLKADNALQEIRRLLLKHKKAPVEFARKEKLVLWNQDVETLDQKQLAQLLSKTKVFIDGIRNPLRTHLLKEAGTP